MKKVISKVFLLVMVVALVATGCSLPNNSKNINEGLVENKVVNKVSHQDRYLVTFKTRPGKADKDFLKGKGAQIRREYVTFPEIVAISVPASAINGISHNPNVEMIEPDYTVYAFSETTPWGVNAVNAPAVWNTTTGQGVKVAVLDTGIAWNHPDLAANYKGGYDFVNNDNDPFDGNGHGTHCSGTIGAVTNNNEGVSSVAYNVDLYGVKVLSDEGPGSTSDILAGVDWAVQNGMDIASMSLGGGRFLKTADRVYKQAAAAGLLVICATGNDAATSVSYPAAYSSNMAVGAVDSDLMIADFSNTGREVDVVAPGVHVLSTVPLGFGLETTVTNTTEADAMEFSPAGEVTGLTYFCNMGETAADFPAAVAGNIALIQRGNISFADKVTNAMNAGAAAVIVFNNEPGQFGGTLGAAGNWVPTVSISMEDGEAMKLVGAVENTISIVATDYDYYDGTSMATPHVSAVAALVKGANPALTNEEIKQILKDTATDLGDAGWDSIYGYGMVNAEAAVAAAVGTTPPNPGNTVTDTFNGTVSAYNYVEKFVTVTGGTIDVSVEGRRLELNLYAPNGSLIATGGSSLSYNTNGTAGEYTVRVVNPSNKNVNYSLSVTYEG